MVTVTKSVTKSSHEASDSSASRARAVEDWLAATDDQLEPGDPLFPKMRGEVIYPEPMSLRTLDLLVKRVAKRANLEAEFSTHSRRAGCATSLGSLGVELSRIQEHLRHESSKTTRIYIRPSDGLDRDPLRKRL